MLKVKTPRLDILLLLLTHSADMCNDTHTCAQLWGCKARYGAPLCPDEPSPRMGSGVSTAGSQALDARNMDNMQWGEGAQGALSSG